MGMGSPGEWWRSSFVVQRPGCSPFTASRSDSHLHPPDRLKPALQAAFVVPAPPAWLFVFNRVCRSDSLKPRTERRQSRHAVRRALTPRRKSTVRAPRRDGSDLARPSSHPHTGSSRSGGPRAPAKIPRAEPRRDPPGSQKADRPRIPRQQGRAPVPRPVDARRNRVASRSLVPPLSLRTFPPTPSSPGTLRVRLIQPRLRDSTDTATRAAVHVDPAPEVAPWWVNETGHRQWKE